MDTHQQRKMLSLIGLGVRGRGAVVGVERVRDAAKRGKLHLAIAAPDASSNSLNKVVPLLQARGITVLAGPSAVELGEAAGRETTIPRPEAPNRVRHRSARNSIFRRGQ